MNIHQLGVYGPHLMMVLSLPVLWNRRILLNYTLIGVCVNVLANMILKFLFHCPRPGNDTTDFVALVSRTTFLQSIETDPYGFPSGHSQSAAFLAAMIYYAVGLAPITVLMAIYTVCIMWQRVSAEKHYVYQVIGGAIIGVVMATGTYYSYRHHLIGVMIHKLDDFSKIF